MLTRISFLNVRFAVLSWLAGIILLASIGNGQEPPPTPLRVELGLDDYSEKKESDDTAGNDADPLQAKLKKAEKATQFRRLDEAREILQPLLKEFPKNADVHYRIARVYEAEFKWGDAIKECSYALELDPQHNAARKARGMFLKLAKQDLDAFRDLDEYLKVRPDDDRVRVAHCEILTNHDNYKLALKDAELLVEKFPEGPYQNCLKAVCLGGLGRFDEALKLHEEALAMEGATTNPSMYSQYARTLRAAGKANKACEMLAEGIKVGDQRPETFSRLGRLYWSDFRESEAVEAMRNAYQRKPNDPLIRSAFAEYLTINPKRTNEDLLEAKQVMESHYQDSKERYWVEPYTLAMVYSELGDFDNAVKFQEEVVHANGADPEKMQKALTAYQNKTPYSKAGKLPIMLDWSD